MQFGSLIRGPRRCSVHTFASAADTGNNVLGQAIKKTYEIGTDSTIRWGVLKSSVVPPEQGGKAITWEQYRKQTEPQRKQLRKEFAENLEVISYKERDRRRLAGSIFAVVSAIGTAYLVSNHAATSQRLWLYPGIALAIAFIDSAIQGLCTESMAGAWDVDDTGLEYMPSQDIAERVQQKVLKMYLRDFGIAVGVMALVCAL